MADTNPRLRPDSVGVEGARPYTAVGLVPEGANNIQRRPHQSADSQVYWSDAPYVEAYNDRAICGGTRTDGAACKAKAKPGEQFCNAHSPEG